MSSALEKILKDFIPKKDIQHEEFLQRYPKYDGRGLFIAIIDSGIDISLDGLQKTSTGLPKILDCFDFSGAGDVDTSVVRKIQKNNTLLLLSGKEVNIPQKWKNQSNEWHLGIKSLKQMTPQKLNKYDNTTAKREEENCFEIKAVNPKETIENLNFVMEMHNNDSIDCIVWNDGKKWCTCIISPSSINLENVKIITNFCDEHDYCFIYENICCCVTIKNDGNFLELFFPYLEHGSYCAQVAAAHYPDQPEKDGLAPGAQILSINITSRLDDNRSIRKGIRKALANERGIIMIQSAGNYGPFISSIRLDTNDIIDEMLTIGSLFTSDMKPLVGKEDDNSPAHLCSSSSKGPLENGARGVTFVAPGGGSMVENPRWHLSKKQIFGGTSCASPIAAGAIACLLTGLKANSIKYTPAMLKLALSNTAFLPDVGDRLGFGNGIIQINSAFEYFKTFKMDLLSKFLLPKIFTKKSKRKGIVFYKLSCNIFECWIQIESDQEEIPWILKLTPEENHKHIKYSKTITNNLFNVKIDAKKLKPGTYYYSEIQGFDPSNLSMGPLFYFPITVIVPEITINNYIERKIFVKSPSKFNLFIRPNRSCNKCTVKLHDPEEVKVVEFEMTIKKSDYKNIYKTYLEHKNEFTFRPNGSPRLWVIKIQWGKVFEIYIFQHGFTESDFDLKSCLKMFFEE